MNYPNPVTITVKEVNRPQTGKQQWKIIDTTGKSWGAWPDIANNMAPGMTYMLTKIDTNEFKGRTYYTIKEAIPATPSPLSMPPQVNPSPYPVSAPAHADTNRVMLTEKDEMIFVCGGFNNIMSNPNVNPKDWGPQGMISLVNALRETWAKTIGAGPLGAKSDDPWE